MSLLTMCQHVARITPVEVPTVIVGNTDKTASLLLACAQEEGEALNRRPEKYWTIMVREHTFATSDGTATYSLPSDFRYLVDGTVWDRSNYWDMRGPLTPQEWQQYKSSVLGSTVTTRKRYRLRYVTSSVVFAIDPTPTASENCVFEYVSTNWCKSSGGTGQSSWAADTDTGVLDEYLMRLGIRWRFLERLGLDFDSAYQEYEREVNSALGRDAGARVLNLTTPRVSPNLIGPANVPDTGFGS